MARTKAEIRAFLDRQVGGVPLHPAPYGPGSGQDLSGQCVTLIKVLMDFLGVPNPYAARGNAISVNDTLLRQGIAKPGTGWLNIVVNRDMGYIGGVHYGHIWIDLAGEANYESNGRQALHTTKNTRPISQGQQIVNLDAYVASEGSPLMIIGSGENWYNRCNITHWAIRGRELSRETFKGFVGKEFLTFVEVCEDDPEAAMVSNWQNVGKVAVTDRWDQQIYTLQDQLKAMGNRPTPEQLAEAKKQAGELATQLADAKKAGEAAQKRASELEAEKVESVKTGELFTLWLGSLLNKLKIGGK